MIDHPNGFADYDEYGRTENERTNDGAGHTYTVQTTYDTQKACVTQITDRTGAVTNTTCNARGNITQSALVVPTPTGLDAAATLQPSQTRTTNTVYDALGRITKVSLPDDGVNTRMAKITGYYPNGLVKWTCLAPASASDCDPASANQRVTQYTYYASGHVATVKAPAKDPVGAATTLVTTTYEYDKAGNVSKTTLGAPSETSRVTDTISDGQGRPISVDTDVVATNAATMQYNDTGAGDGLTGPVVTTTDTGGVATVSRVDPLGRPVSSKTGTLPATTTAYGEQVASGFLGSKTIDEWGVYAKQTYTAWGEAKRITAPTGTSGTAKDIVYAFDAMGRATSVQDRNGKTTSYQYDGDGRLTQSSQTIGGTAKTWQYVYDAAGQRVEVKDPDGRYRDFTYDVNGNPVGSYEYKSDTGHSYQGRNSRLDTTNTYDQWGNLTKTDDPLTGTLDFTYDHLGQLTHRQQTISGTGSGKEDFAYDVWGRQTSAQTDNGSGTDDLWITYDAADRTDQIKRGASLGAATTETDYGYVATTGRLGSIVDLVGTTSYAYDSNTGQLNEVDDPLTATGQTTYSYDYIARTITRDDPAGLRTIRSLDAAGRPVDQKVVKTSNPGGATLVDFKYVYDDDSNVTSADQTVGGGNTGSGTWAYAYDDAGRLTSQDAPGASNTTTYAYDGAGNRTSATFNGGAGVTTSYDGANRPISQVQSGSTLQAYTYNNAGELTQTSINSGATVWDDTYDPWGRQTQAKQTVDATVTNLDYTYDALGRTLSRAKTGAGTTTYTYQGVGEDVVKVSGSPAISYALLPSGPLAQKKNSTVRVIGRNLHGDVSFLANPTNQNITDTLTYTAWGEKTTTGTDGAAEALTYQADLTDPDTGTVDMGTRLYDPTQGRFTTRDILFGDPTDPQTLNPYIYGGDSPVIYVDPTGMIRTCAVDCDAAGAKDSVKQSSQTIANTIAAQSSYNPQSSSIYYRLQRQAAPPAPPAPPAPVVTRSTSGCSPFNLLCRGASALDSALVGDAEAAEFQNIQGGSAASGGGGEGGFGYTQWSQIPQRLSPGSIPGEAATGAQGGRLGKAPRGAGSVPPEQRDPQRLFDPSQRTAMEAQQAGNCGNCDQPLGGVFQAHHVDRWADGGPTTLDNGVALCVPCHIWIHSP